MKRSTAAGPSSSFWLWSNWQSIGTRAENFRTVLELSNPPHAVLDRMNYGQGRLDPTVVPVLEGDLEYKSRADDCPWPVQDMFPVSDRLRGIAEAAAPGNCQFFPMKLRHNGQPCPLVYWAMYVDSLDCADPEKSRWDVDRRVIYDPVIIENRVPASIYVFRIKHFTSALLVRDTLRCTLKKEKITGCGFYTPWFPTIAGD